MRRMAEIAHPGIVLFGLLKYAHSTGEPQENRSSVVSFQNAPWPILR